MADKIDVVRSRICTAEHIVGANCNVKSAAHFFIQSGIPAQFRHVGVHAEAKLTDDSVFRRLLLKKGGDIGLIAAGYLPVSDIQQDMLVFRTVKVKRFKINRPLGFVSTGAM